MGQQHKGGCMNDDRLSNQQVTELIVKAIGAHRDLGRALDALEAGDHGRAREMVLLALMRFGSLTGSRFVEALNVQIREGNQ